MDILKALLCYMVITVSGAVTTLEATPVPYAVLNTPTPIVTATPVPTPTPEPTATPTPLPTATPRLYVLSNGSAGTNVRNLQARLIELGYLDGEPDGAFGEQTEKAVKAFQRKNGLKVDGVAGIQTQTKLFYDENVVKAK